MKILYFSPVKKENEIVKLHLQSIKDLIIPECVNITFSFFDDNIEEKSSQLLNSFVSSRQDSIFMSIDNLESNKNHLSKKRWEINSYKRITIIKDYAIKYFLDSDFDYLFLVDSDLILHPSTLKNLLSQNKDFCSEIFWTNFSGSITYTPNCWYDKKDGFIKEDLLKFQKKGTYQVDYTGACTLLSKQILLDGVRFEKIPNVGYLGEDKHFCIRAAVNNYKIYINTESPAFHLYNTSLLEMGAKFIQNNYNLDYLNDWLDTDWLSAIKEYGLVKKKKTFLKRVVNKLINN